MHDTYDLRCPFLNHGNHGEKTREFHSALSCPGRSQMQRPGWLCFFNYVFFSYWLTHHLNIIVNHESSALGHTSISTTYVSLESVNCVAFRAIMGASCLQENSEESTSAQIQLLAALWAAPG